MRTVAIVSTALAVVMAAPASAAYFTVTTGSSNATIPVSDDFKPNLNALGLTNITHSGGIGITLNKKATLKFEYMGSESSYNTSFTAPPGTFQEFGDKAWGPVSLFQYLRGAGAIGAQEWVFNSNDPNGAANAGLGTQGFGIFNPGQSFSSNVIYLGFDDQLRLIDDNHDDLLIRVTAIPEPASWAMLICGFGLVGAVSRRRKQAIVSA